MTDNQIMQKIDEGVNMGENLALLGLKIEIFEMKSHIKESLTIMTRAL